MLANHLTFLSGSIFKQQKTLRGVSVFAGLLFYFAGQCPAALPCKQVRLMRDHQPIGSTRNRTGTQGATLSTCHWWDAPKLWPPGMAPGSRGRNQMVIHPLISAYTIALRNRTYRTFRTNFNFFLKISDIPFLHYPQLPFFRDVLPPAPMILLQKFCI